MPLFDVAGNEKPTEYSHNNFWMEFHDWKGSTLHNWFIDYFNRNVLHIRFDSSEFCNDAINVVRTH